MKVSGEQAVKLLKEIRAAGGRCVSRAVSPHGSDCPSETHSRMHCRCLSVFRLRVPTSGEHWLLLLGDRAEGPVFQVSGPYSDAPLYYGGGFWDRVELRYHYQEVV